MNTSDIIIALLSLTTVGVLVYFNFLDIKNKESVIKELEAKQQVIESKTLEIENLQNRLANYSISISRLKNEVDKLKASLEIQNSETLELLNLLMSIKSKKIDTERIEKLHLKYASFSINK